MPAEAAKIYGYLSGEILRTRAKWIYFKQLFMDSSYRTGKLKGAGGSFWREIQNILQNDLILSLARLTDPARNAHQENLSLSLFVERLEGKKVEVLVLSLKGKLTSLKSVVRSLRTHRAKRVAHYDANTVISPETSPLPELQIREFRLAIETIESFLGEVHFFFTNSTFMWDALRTYDDADTLMVRLCKAEIYDELADAGTVDRHSWRKKWSDP